ncbi:MAG: hypothetical protein DHS80DRAFT_33594 [Piptocephalis tieghemiana]|nr:MAG: hypothetical protein DHS80DRAFT_33594 [Piptocephalis tieghemiana]
MVPVLADKYLGCYNVSAVDLSGLAKAGKPNPYVSIMMLPSLCSRYCTTNHLTYAGIRNGTMCYCGGSEPRMPKLSDQACGMPCEIQPTTMCGGVETVSLYSIVVSTPGGDVTQNNALPSLGMSSRTKMILGASIGGGVLVLLSLLAGMFIYRRRRRDREALEARGSVLQDKIASGQGLGIPGQAGLGAGVPGSQSTGPRRWMASWVDPRPTRDGDEASETAYEELDDSEDYTPRHHGPLVVRNPDKSLKSKSSIEGGT